MNLSKRNIFTLAAIALLVTVICAALVACDTSTTPPDDHNGGNAQADITTITSLDEILSALGNDYKVSEKVLASAQRKYGSSLAVLKSENADGTGEILVGTDEDGALKVATTSLSLSAGDFTARVFKSGTFTRTGNTLSYYIDNEKQEEDISGALTKTAESGDLTVVDTSLADEKIDALFENVTLEESGLKTGITNTEKEIFSLVAGNVINEDTEVILPSLTCNYNSMTDKTEVKAVYFLGGKVTTCTVSFDGDLTADGFDKEKAQDQIYKETATVATADKDCSQYDGYTNVYCIAFFALTVEKVPSAQDLEEVITFNSWEEVFNVFGEENSDLVKNKLSEILTEKLLNEQNIKSIFGNSMTLEDLTNGKIEILKWAFELTDNEISSVQMLGIRNGYQSDKDKWAKSTQFNLKDNVSLGNIIGKKNLDKVLEGEYILNDGEIYLDFSGFSNKLELENFKHINQFLYAPIKIEETMTDEEKAKQQEKLDIFNLLMPYAVNEKTTYSHVSLSYLESSAIEGYDLAFVFTIRCFNEATNTYETKGLTVKSYRNSGMSIIESCEKALIDGDYEFTELENKQMLSGDIIFSLDNDDITYYEINPTAQQ